MKKKSSKPDLLWKDLFEEFDSEFILFFLGSKLYDSIDFTVAPEFLEQEFNEAFAANEPKKKIVDKIVRYRLKNGESRFIIIHIEFQGKGDKHFAERMFRYFAYIYIKYGTTNITALALYTGASRPKVYDVFKIELHGTKLSYQFNTYTVREQDEAELLKSDNPFALAVLASLYLIKAGKDAQKRLEYKKKLAETIRSKDFGFEKFFRLLNFVRYLITLPKNLEIDFKISSYQSIIQDKMQADKEKRQAEKEFFLEYSNVLGVTDIINNLRDESLEKGRMQEREELIMNIFDTMGFSAEQIAKMTKFSVEYIQSVIDKHAKK